MNTVLIDNVNNLSGAPAVAKNLAALLHSPIFCIRQSKDPIYLPEDVGIVSDRRRHYFTGIFGLLFSKKFWKRIIAVRFVICNTCLSFPFAILARLLGKKVVCLIHESAAKNILYRVALFASKKIGHLIITPSRAAYLHLSIPAHKWLVIPNALAPEYSDAGSSVSSSAERINLLFVGGDRTYKGDPLFRGIKNYCQKRNPNLHFEAVGDEDFLRTQGNSLRLGPQVYTKYHFVLILTDNRVWKETFGLVGCEAAACRCLPLFTDKFAYTELWSNLSEYLFLPTYEPIPIVERIEKLLIDRPMLDRLRDSAQSHALNLTNSQSVAKHWLEALERIVGTNIHD